MQKLLTAASVAAVIIATAVALAGVHNASERRAKYLAQEAAYFECVDSGLSRVECAQGVF